MADATDPSPTSLANRAIENGDTFFSDGKYVLAVDSYTHAINLIPYDAVFYSKRSAAQAALKNFKEALQDAQTCLKLNSESAEGYSRLGSAFYGLRQFKEAAAAYTDALKIFPDHAGFKSGYDSAFVEWMKQERMRARLALDPQTSWYKEEPDFDIMVEDFLQSPISAYLHDKRFMRALGVMSDAVKINIQEGSVFPDGGLDSMCEDLFGEDVLWLGGTDERLKYARNLKLLWERAKQLNESGTEAYKNREFNMAFEFYSMAISLDPYNSTYLTNRAAVHMETGKLQECIDDCDKAVEAGKVVITDPNMAARAFSRKGTALVKLAKQKCPDEQQQLYLAATQSFHEAQKYHPDLDISVKLADVAICLKELGNKAFKKKQLKSAVLYYSKAIELNEDDISLLTLRAAAYMEMEKVEECISDCDKALEKLKVFSDSKTVAWALTMKGRALTMKGHAFVRMAKQKSPNQQQQLNKAAIQSFQEAKKYLDPDSSKKLADAEGAKMESEKERRAKAIKLKECGNTAYKNREFDKALVFYSDAIELDEDNISFLTNRAAVYMEMGKFNECVEDCDKALERGKELNSDLMMVVRALTRKNTALVRMAEQKCPDQQQQLNQGSVAHRF